MSQCITANPTSLSVETLDDSLGNVYTVKVDSETPQLRIYFTPPRTEVAVGAISSVTVNPSGPTCGDDWVEFTTSHIGTEYTVEVGYTDPTSQDRSVTPPLETPSKSPKFKPQTTCPPTAPD